ncbi:kinase-like domain-containing protein [Phycomyces nitens]|nr:kinase-like domain-containing protein [Phycomyces nitens]
MTKTADPHDEYEFLEQIGNGSFGSVHRAKNKETQHIVAVKVMKKKFSDSSECNDLREIKLLGQMPAHPNIVQLYDSFLSPVNDLYFVMEFMDHGNLYQLIKTRREEDTTISNQEIKDIVQQMLAALAHVHQHNIFHRDMKPENLLIGSSQSGPIIKLADFGLARELNSKPPYTDYVQGPEVLLRSPVYAASVDLWAVGAIIAELITLQPLFPGQSEIDQLYRICQVMGSPGKKTFVRKRARPEKRVSPGFARKKASVIELPPDPSVVTLPADKGEWREGVRLAHKIGFDFPQLLPKPLETVVPCDSEPLLDLVRQCLVFTPELRITAKDALSHPFITDIDPNVTYTKLATDIMITASPTTTTDAIIIPQSPQESSVETATEPIAAVCHAVESSRQIRPPTALEVATRSHVMRNTFNQDRNSFDMSNLAMIPFQPYSKWPFKQYQRTDMPDSESTSRRSSMALTTTTIVDSEGDFLDQMSLLTNQTSPASSAETLPKSPSQPMLESPLSHQDNQIQPSQQITESFVYEDSASTHSPRHPKLPESPIWTPTPSKRRDEGSRDDSERHTHRRLGFHHTRHAFEPIDAPLPVFQLDTVPHYASITPWISTLHPDTAPSVSTILPAPPAEVPKATDSFTTALFRQFYQKPPPPPPPVASVNDTKFASIPRHATAPTVSVSPDSIPVKKSPAVRFSFWSQKKPVEDDKEKRIEEIVSINPNTNNGATGSGRANNEGDHGRNKEWRWLKIL